MAQVQEVSELATAVRERRRAMGLSQLELSRLAHVSRKWISEFERGKENVEMTAVLHVCKALGLPLGLQPVVEPGDVLDDDEIDRRIIERAERTSFGGTLAQMGVTTVALDENGDLMRYHPDGTRTPLT